jgi:hypothetical protein
MRLTIGFRLAYDNFIMNIHATAENSTLDELVQLYVPRRHYLATLNFVASLASDNPATTPITLPPPETSSLINGWTVADVHRLRKMLMHNAGATALFNLTCVDPEKRVSFPDVCKESGRTSNQARADLSELTKLIRRTWGRDRRWPLGWVQDGTSYIYHASPQLAEAWNSAS